jgi:hypothetical protein
MEVFLREAKCLCIIQLSDLIISTSFCVILASFTILNAFAQKVVHFCKN